jgi:Protein of unknown function (DUF4242)
MKTLAALIPALFMYHAFAASPTSSPAMAADTEHRYLIERTFPSGALEGLDAATKAKVNTNNASVGVQWKESYANADKTKTFCVYNGPNEAAIRKAAVLNGLPIDKITEVPVDVNAAKQTSEKDGVKDHRFIVERTVTPGTAADAASNAKLNSTNARFGVRWLTTYANADKTKAYLIYEAPSEAALRKAASANDIVVDSVTEIPLTLFPI